MYVYIYIYIYIHIYILADPVGVVEPGEAGLHGHGAVLLHVGPGVAAPALVT